MNHALHPMQHMAPANLTSSGRTGSGKQQPEKPDICTTGTQIREAIESEINQTLSCGQCVGYLRGLNKTNFVSHRDVVKYLSAEFPWPSWWREKNTRRREAISRLIDPIVASPERIIAAFPRRACGCFESVRVTIEATGNELDGQYGFLVPNDPDFEAIPGTDIELRMVIDDDGLRLQFKQAGTVHEIPTGGVYIGERCNARFTFDPNEIENQKIPVFGPGQPIQRLIV